MRFGLFGINIGLGSQPETLLKVAQAADPHARIQTLQPNI